MSSRPSITSCTSHLDGRRKLPPMRSYHPKLRTLRQCTSLEWVYNSTTDPDCISDDRMVIRVGEDISLDPADKRAVPMEDGSLPVMSYCLAACVGEYELVLSDHRSIVDMSCVEDHATILPYDEGDLEQPQKPLKTLYNRWTINIQFSKDRKHGSVDGVNVHNTQTATNVNSGSMSHALKFMGVGYTNL
ncbi:uncharacterized protein F5147DRAFT_652963 [Suillus discolor]|uniref:Uncharacterized protein n=1 Tax=Suillus discolor TaxID=1912936 RepID=A0A9P7JTP0_9AGAM|nr:uncharacterized protein F5147DRAFT_652963 [Suillus discolor]KAG2108244.1 hypothetical protein F5147DRAFT_652963 [Suillus discolor]